MADQKISQLNSLLGANTASGDLVTVVDISDTTMGASGTNKKMTLAEFQASPVSAGTANGVLFLNGTKVPSSGSGLWFDGTNFGIGTASPGGRLHSYAGTGIGAGHAIFGDSAIGYWNFNSGGSPSGRVIARGYDSSAVEQIRLDPSGDSFLLGGNLGIGTASPTVKLHVSSTATEVIFQDSDTAKAASLTALLSLHGSDGRAGYVGYPADSSLYINNQNNTPMLFLTNNTERMRLDASGNLGLGVTPSQWLSGGYMDFPGNGFVGNAVSFSSNSLFSGLNASYYSGQWRYKASSLAASTFGQVNGAFQWNIAGSGTAGNAITFTQAMTLDASGNLGLNTSTFGTSAAGVLSLGTGTAPTTGPADTVQLFSVDRSAGNTIPAIRCEGSGVTNAGITSTAVTNKIAVQVNGTIYYLLATTNAT